jgi:hypothetical protein
MQDFLITCMFAIFLSLKQLKDYNNLSTCSARNSIYGSGMGKIIAVLLVISFLTIFRAR